MGNPYSNVNADGSDIRFTASDGTTLQDYWIESWDNTGDSRIWVEVKTSGESTICMYYGNPSASAAGNGDATFLFFDGFDRSDSAAVGNGWTEFETLSSTAEIASNDLSLTPYDEVKRPLVLKSFSALSGKFRWMFSFDWTRTGTEKSYWLYMQLGEFNSLNNNPQAGEVISQDAASAHWGTGVDLVWYKGAASTHQVLSYYDNNAIQADVATVSGNHTVEIVGDASAGTYDMNVDGGPVEKSGAAMNETTTLDTMRFMAHGLNYQNFGQPRAFGYTFIAKYTNPEPSTSVGDEETPLYVNLESFTAVGSNGKVMLRWSTGAEIDSAGFNILRSDYPDGQFSRINSSLIPSRGDSFAGADYASTDYDVVNGNVYRYMLEEIETGGNANLYGPVSATPGIISLLNPMDGGSVLLCDPRFEITASPGIKRMALYISPRSTLKGKGTIRVRVRRGRLRGNKDGAHEVKLGRRSRMRLERLAAKNGWTLYSGVYGVLKGEKRMQLMSKVNRFGLLLGASNR